MNKPKLEAQAASSAEPLLLRPAEAARLPEHQQRLLRIVGEVLHIDEVPLDAGFVELGGDSLNVTQLLLRVAAEFDREIPAEAVFQSRTLRELAETIAPGRAI